MHLDFVDQVDQSGGLQAGLGDTGDLVSGSQGAVDKLADDDLSIGLGLCVSISGCINDGLVCCVLFHGNADSLACLHSSAVLGLFHGELDLSDGLALVGILNDLNAVALDVSKLLVIVGSDDDVDLGAGVSQIVSAGVGNTVLVVLTHVLGGNDDVDLILDLVDDLLGLLDGISDGVVLQVLCVPADDVGGDHADDSNLHTLDLLDDIASTQSSAVSVVDITAQEVAFKIGGQTAQSVNAVVELMVARNPDVIVHQVQALDHGMDVIFEEQLCRVALDGITAVNDQGVVVSDFVDEGSQLSDTASCALCIQSVVIGNELAVQVRGGQDLDLDSFCSRRSCSFISRFSRCGIDLVAAGGKGQDHCHSQQKCPQFREFLHGITLLLYWPWKPRH